MVKSKIIEIVKHLDCLHFSDDDKFEAILQVAYSDLSKAVTKDDVVAALVWIVDNLYKGV